MNKIYKEISSIRVELTKYAKKFKKDQFTIDEVIQETMLYFLTMNQNTLKDIYEKSGRKGLIGYGCIVIKRSLTSKRSPYYYKIDKYYSHIQSVYQTTSTYENKEIGKYFEDTTIPDEYTKWYKLELIDKIIEDMYWYDRDIFKLYYYEGHTLDSLAEKTKISRNSLFTTIDNVRNEIKRILDECKEE